MIRQLNTVATGPAQQSAATSSHLLEMNNGNTAAKVMFDFISRLCVKTTKVAFFDIFFLGPR